MNILSILLLALIGLAVVAALLHMRRHKPTSCGGSCASCGMHCPHRQKTSPDASGVKQ